MRRGARMTRRSARARWRGRRCRSIASDWRRRSGSRGSRATRSTRWAIATSRSSWSRRRAGPGAPVAAGRGAGAVDDVGVRVRADRRGVLLGVEPHAAEDEPRPGGAAARQSRAHDRRVGDAGDGREGAAAGLQQGSAGDSGAAVRRGGDVRGLPRGGARHDRQPSSSMSRGCGPRSTRGTWWRPSWPITW